MHSILFALAVLMSDQVLAATKYDNVSHYQLKSTLFAGYDSGLRPVIDIKTTTHVLAFLNLNQILTVVINHLQLEQSFNYTIITIND